MLNLKTTRLGVITQHGFRQPPALPTRRTPTTPRVGEGIKSVRSGSAAQRRAAPNAVEILEKRFGYFPQRFMWRGKTHHVQAVEQCSTKMGRRAQLCFRVRCAEGTFDLAQDCKTNIWSISVV